MRDARAKWAKNTINKTIPALLKSDARARKGVESSQLIVDPPPATSSESSTARSKTTRGDGAATEKGEGSAERLMMNPSSASTPQVQITMCIADTLKAASKLVQASKTTGNRRPSERVAILNMASPLRPGGGVLTGASSQEESLCSRTTLYPSLREEFYRLPEVGAVYTPDVLVFATSSWDDEGRADPDLLDMLPRQERFYIDVITAAMLRYPDVEEGKSEGERGGDGGDGGGPRYALEKDRDMALRKMRAVMRILRLKGVEKVVLGAWGCGAYGNPVEEIAKAWKKVLLGGEPKRGGRKSGTNAEGWDRLEIVFAIKDSQMAKNFAKCFGPGLTVDEDWGGETGEVNDRQEDGQDSSRATLGSETK